MYANRMNASCTLAAAVARNAVGGVGHYTRRAAQQLVCTRHELTSALVVPLPALAQVRSAACTCPKVWAHTHQRVHTYPSAPSVEGSMRITLYAAQRSLSGLSHSRITSSNVRALSSPASRASQGDEKELTLKERFKMIAKDYGKVVMLSHSAIWAGSLVGTWAAIQSMDMTRFLALLPTDVASHVDPSAGAFAIAFVLVKLTGPLRLMIDIALAPMLARYLRRTWLAGPLGLKSAPTSARTLNLRSAREEVAELREEVTEAVSRGARRARSGLHRMRESVKHAPAAAGSAPRLWLKALWNRFRGLRSVGRSLPRLRWIRLRERSAFPLSAAAVQTLPWRARTLQALARMKATCSSLVRPGRKRTSESSSRHRFSYSSQRFSY